MIDTINPPQERRGGENKPCPYRKHVPVYYPTILLWVNISPIHLTVQKSQACAGRWERVSTALLTKPMFKGNKQTKKVAILA